MSKSDTPAQSLIRIGEAHRKAHAFSEAIPFYQQALELIPGDGATLLHLADAYRGLKDLEKCLFYWREYLDHHPGDARVHSRIADAFKKTGRRELAISHYTKAIEIDPTSTYALMGLGDLHYKEQAFDEALIWWERLLGIDPTIVNILTMVGNIHRKKFNFQKAVECFGLAIQVAPENPYAIFGMADALRGQGHFKEAAPHWEAILKLDRKNKQVLTRAGDCFLRLGELSRAEDLFKEALLPGYDKAALLGLARVFTQRRKFSEARRQYERILERQPKDERTLALLAQVVAANEGFETAGIAMNTDGSTQLKS